MSIERRMQLVGHCGPACVSMLLEDQGVQRTQEAIAYAAGVSATISESGSRIDQLAAAIDDICPEFILLGRYNSDLTLVATLLSNWNLVVGVEWQGRFTFENSHYQFDIGHYSLITGIDVVTGRIDIVDPDNRSVFMHGHISIEQFLPRWWEDNELIKGSKFRSFGLLFVVFPRMRAVELQALGIEPINFEFSRRSSIAL